jgi:3-oxoadipate enol-lactonase
VLNAEYIAKWRARPNEALREPAVCLQGRDDLLGRLSEITCPALVVHGVDDVAIDMASAEALAAGLPGSDGVVKVPGAHAANLTHPEPVNAAIGQFLASLPD